MNSQGYGRFTVVCSKRGGSADRNKQRVRALAHRFAYENQVGPIPDGLVLDHLCRVPLCCNPAHLEPVTQLVNVRRGANAIKDGKCRRCRGDMVRWSSGLRKGLSLRCPRCRSVQAARRYRAKKEARQ